MQRTMASRTPFGSRKRTSRFAGCTFTSTPPGSSSRNRNVTGYCPFITAAIREGYHTALMKGQYPVTFLFLELDPGGVDVNVHPAKREVRFRDPTAVREAIVRCIQETLASRRAD